jgi:hypothetical protein
MKKILSIAAIAATTITANAQSYRYDRSKTPRILRADIN